MEYGWSALMLALQHSHHETARLLVERGADVNFESEGGHTALTLLTLRFAEEEPNKEADAEFLPLLKKSGLQIGLREAALLKDLELAAMLLENGEDIDGTDKLGRTALMLATSQRNHEMMHLLVSCGANINAQEWEIGITALMIASQNKDQQAIEILLAAGADAGIRNRFGHTAFRSSRGPAGAVEDMGKLLALLAEKVKEKS